MSIPILPYAMWESGTNQNSVPANDNSLRNQLLNGLIISGSTNAQPATPANGDAYIIAGAPTGAQWSLFDQYDLAIYQEGTWYAYAPVSGIVINLAGSLKRWNGSAYVDVGTAGGVDTVNGLSGTVIVPVPIGLACSDETTPLTAGVAKCTFRMPHAMQLTQVRATLTTAQSSGSIFTVDINESGATILSTKITIDNTEKTSSTAAIQPVISDTSLANDAEITIDIDQIGNGTATGLKVWMIGYPT